MTQYRIDQVGVPRSWQGQSGSFLDYPLRLADQAGNVTECYVTQKDSTAAPTQGQMVEGDIRQDNRGNLKFKRAPQGRPGGGGGRSGGGMSPEREAKVVRQHSQKVAAHLLSIKYPNGLPEGANLLQELTTIVDHLEKHVAAATQQPPQAQPQQQAAPQQQNWGPPQPQGFPGQ